jgi:hypothetical protein
MRSHKLFSPRVETLVFDITVVLLISTFMVTGFYIFRLKVAALIFGTELPMKSALRMFKPIEDNRRHMRDLALMPPPSDSTEIAAWAAGIESHVGYPLVVFLQRDTVIRVVRAPEQLSRFAPLLSSLFNPALPIKERIKTDDTVSTLIFRHAETKADSASANVYAFGRTTDGQGWGVFYLNEDMWHRWAAGLFKPSNSAPHAIPKDSSKSSMTSDGEGMNVRVFDGDRLIGASSTVDTTAEKFEFKFGKKKIIFYDQTQTKTYLNLLRHPYIIYSLLVLNLAVIFVLVTYHRAYRRMMLTLPETTHDED